MANFESIRLTPTQCDQAHDTAYLAVLGELRCLQTLMSGVYGRLFIAAMGEQSYARVKFLLSHLAGGSDLYEVAN